MSFTKKYSVLVISLILLFLLDIASGTVFIPLNKIWSCFYSHTNDSETIIILGFRLPKALAAICAGSSLAVAGMLMQTFFKNPLAGPHYQ